MNSLQFPLKLTFSITTLSNDFVVKDATDATVAYVRQKILKIFEEVQVYNNESRSELNYTIRANKWLDFSASYLFANRNGYDVGRLIRKGWASLWKAHYEIFDENQLQNFVIREENPWTKVFDSMLSEIPLVGILSGYIFHPAYIVSRPDNSQVLRLRKVPSFFGRSFIVDKLSDLKTDEEERLLLGLMMLILLERRRG